MYSANQSNSGDNFIVKARGLPWAATDDDIINFFDESTIVNNGIHRIMLRSDRFSGEIFVEFPTKEDMDKALQKNNEYMSKRYIEVFETTAEEMNYTMKSHSTKGSNIVKLRGLPFQASKEEVAQFFAQFPIKPNGIHFVPLGDPRMAQCNGEAFVEFVDADTARASLVKNTEKIGHRWIEIFMSSESEMNRQISSFSGVSGYRSSSRGSLSSGSSFRNRPSPYDRNMSSRGMRFGSRMMGGFYDDEYQEHVHYPHMQQEETFKIKMRGLPFNSTEHDIVQFFAPVLPVLVRIFRDKEKRVQGAIAEFSHFEDFQISMEKDRQMIGRRYIELFECLD